MTELLITVLLCGTGISLFSIYMHYRAQGVGVLFSGARKVRKRDIEDIKQELTALREGLDEMRVDSEKAQELMADILLSVHDRDRALRAGDPSDTQ